MFTRSFGCLILGLALCACGRKAATQSSASSSDKASVSVESLIAKPAEDAPAAPPASETPPAATAQPVEAPKEEDPATSGEAMQRAVDRRYARNIEWLRTLKYADAKKQQEVRNSIKKANLSAKEMAELKEMAAHFLVQL
jgi:hypothetical protein